MAFSNRPTTDIGVRGIIDGEMPPGADAFEYTNEWPSARDATGVSTSSSGQFASPLSIGRFANVVFFPDLTSTTSIPVVEVYARKSSSAGPVVNIKVWRKSGGWALAVNDPSTTGTLLTSTAMTVSGSAALHTLNLGALYALKELCVEVNCETGSSPTVAIYDVVFTGTRARGILVL